MDRPESPIGLGHRFLPGRRFLRNRKVILGIVILLFFALLALLAPVLTPGDPLDFSDAPNLPPSSDHLLGTTGQGQDVFRQVVVGTRRSLSVGMAVGLIATAFGTTVGLTAAFFGGPVDDLLSLFMNVFLIIPGLPLLVVLAAFLPPGEATMVFALTFTGWAGTSRVVRSQALSLRHKDFVSAAIVSGESIWRIMLLEILPNMASIVAATLIGSIIYGITAQAALEFLGLGNVSAVSWGTILYWAGNNAGLLTGAWWTFLPAGLCIAAVAFALALLNYAIDEFTNPRLRQEKETANVVKRYSRRIGGKRAAI
ncbi:MAG: ABC transporter permease [Aggregatilineales bacterium]